MYNSIDELPSERSLERMTDLKLAETYERLRDTQYANSKGSALRTAANGRMWIIAMRVQESRRREGLTRAKKADMLPEGGSE